MLSVANYPIILSVIMLSVIMLSVIMLSVVMPNVVAPRSNMIGNKIHAIQTLKPTNRSNGLTLQKFYTSNFKLVIVN
jgi:hypothetical protein